MIHRTREVPDSVHEAAAAAWQGWSARLARVVPAGGERQCDPPQLRPPRPGDTAEGRMIAKIRRRMREYPDWYETDPARVSALVVRELARIGATLERDLPRTDQPIEVWRVPLSVFNWLVDGPSRESFVRGALKAWSSAQCFNAANGRSVTATEAAHLRAPFLEIAPPLLKAVLAQLLREDLRISFHQVYAEAEFKFLGLRVKRPA